MSDSDAPRAARVVVGVSGSPGSLAALRRAAGEARLRGAELWPVLAWEAPGGGPGAQRSLAGGVLVEDWARLARKRLLSALCEVFGGTGAGVPLRALVAEGTPARVLVRTADREDDVLVVGSGGRGFFNRVLWPSVGRRCLARAVCPVLVVPPSPLEAALATARRRNAWRLRMDTGHVEREFRAAAAPPEV
ncbi:universal stress protein [Streptomyces sp. NPDC059785]|uniref:universal stress protein n=1 Tax=Streptomyces sp. NPDC059785 TaxID=3346945 RepID=UPI00366A4939